MAANETKKEPGLIQEFGTLIDVPNGLSQAIRADIVRSLNRDLANLQLLYQRYKKDHWTVRGIHFRELHLLFEEHANQVLAHVDEIAERIAGLGGVPVSMPDEIVEYATIGQLPSGAYDVKSMLARTLHALEVMEVEIREDMKRTDELGDLVSNDLLNDTLDTLEKQSWFIASHREHGN
jgi:starvation-inducible DNA-binding protein